MNISLSYLSVCELLLTDESYDLLTCFTVNYESGQAASSEAMFCYTFKNILLIYLSSCKIPVIMIAIMCNVTYNDCHIMDSYLLSLV